MLISWGIAANNVVIYVPYMPRVLARSVWLLTSRVPLSIPSLASKQNSNRTRTRFVAKIHTAANESALENIPVHNRRVGRNNPPSLSLPRSNMARFRQSN